MEILVRTAAIYINYTYYINIVNYIVSVRVIFYRMWRKISMLEHSYNDAENHYQKTKVF